jgi:hypothetical protein
VNSLRRLAIFQYNFYSIISQIIQFLYFHLELYIKPSSHNPKPNPNQASMKAQVPTQKLALDPGPQDCNLGLPSPMAKAQSTSNLMSSRSFFHEQNKPLVFFFTIHCKIGKELWTFILKSVWCGLSSTLKC